MSYSLDLTSYKGSFAEGKVTSLCCCWNIVKPLGVRIWITGVTEFKGILLYWIHPYPTVWWTWVWNPPPPHAFSLKDCPVKGLDKVVIWLCIEPSKTVSQIQSTFVNVYLNYFWRNEKTAVGKHDNHMELQCILQETTTNIIWMWYLLNFLLRKLFLMISNQ